MHRKQQRRAKAVEPLISADLMWTAFAEAHDPDVRELWWKEMESRKPELSEAIAFWITAALGRFASYCGGATRPQVDAISCELGRCATLLYHITRSAYVDHLLKDQPEPPAGRREQE